ncbi:MAG: excinuclease ABC subunit UvrB [Deltaproteobacteria bacterium]|nr:excinuclease ABC subunit UvrB [Deltaproteobacteria bacterium]
MTAAVPFNKLHTPAKGDFRLVSDYVPCGDQPEAISRLVRNIKKGVRFQTLKGVTGSGKTFTIANMIASQQRPALVIAPNKTLAAQLYGEFRQFFPENQVRYFVSYYDYYQPEAYLPASDTYIEKDSAINEEIDKMRHSATHAILESSDTIVVASVSCIYGLGAPEDYFAMMLFLERGTRIPREEVLRKLVYMQYTRSDFDFARGNFRVRGESIDIFPCDQDQRAIRLVFFGDEVEEIREIDSISGTCLRKLERCTVYPSSHFVTSQSAVQKAIDSIKQELKAWLPRLRESGKLLEAQRLEQRTRYDLEILAETGFCPGIENYSRHLTGRAAGSAPTTLVDYFPEDFLLIIDESHVTVPQLGGMYRGDQSRKQTLVDYGFRLPSALDNRPLSPDEFWARIGQTVFVSATPGDFELERSLPEVIELINRPTGLLDPLVVVKPARGQVDDLMDEIREVTARGERALVTTLTKKMAEDLSTYLRELGIKCRYLHADVQTIERVEILRGLRRGDFDVLIGINLLREGLDLVEVSLVAILDADKEGFLRSARSLIQTMGRAARNLNGRVVLYADTVTDSMKQAMAEADRRRSIQASFNERHGIVPKSAQSRLQDALSSVATDVDEISPLEVLDRIITVPTEKKAQARLVEELKREMFEAAASREFERAAALRDAVNHLQKEILLKYSDV